MSAQLEMRWKISALKADSRMRLLLSPKMSEAPPYDARSEGFVGMDSGAIKFTFGMPVLRCTKKNGATVRRQVTSEESLENA